MVENRQFSDTTSQTYVDDFKKFCATPRSKRKFRAPTRAAASSSPELAGKAFSPCKMPAVEFPPGSGAKDGQVHVDADKA